MTKSRSESADEIELALEIYAHEINAYPADVAAYVLHTQPGVNIFWPAWAELKDRLELYSRRRRMVMDALKRGYQRPPSEPKPVRGAEAAAGFRRVREALRTPARPTSAKAADEKIPEPAEMTQDELDRRRATMLAEIAALEEKSNDEEMPIK